MLLVLKLFWKCCQFILRPTGWAVVTLTQPVYPCCKSQSSSVVIQTLVMLVGFHHRLEILCRSISQFQNSNLLYLSIHSTPVIPRVVSSWTGKMIYVQFLHLIHVVQICVCTTCIYIYVCVQIWRHIFAQWVLLTGLYDYWNRSWTGVGSPNWRSAFKLDHQNLFTLNSLIWVNCQPWANFLAENFHSKWFMAWTYWGEDLDVTIIV